MLLAAGYTTAPRGWAMDITTMITLIVFLSLGMVLTYLYARGKYLVEPEAGEDTCGAEETPENDNRNSAREPIRVNMLDDEAQNSPKM